MSDRKPYVVAEYGNVTQGVSMMWLRPLGLNFLVHAMIIHDVSVSPFAELERTRYDQFGYSREQSRTAHCVDADPLAVWPGNAASLAVLRDDFEQYLAQDHAAAVVHFDWQLTKRGNRWAGSMALWLSAISLWTILFLLAHRANP